MATHDETASTAATLKDGWRPKVWKTFKQAAERLSDGGRDRFSPRRLNKAALDGKLKAIRINNRGDWRTLDEWVDDYILSLQTRTFTHKRRADKNDKNVTGDSCTEKAGKDVTACARTEAEHAPRHDYRKRAANDID